MDNNKPIDYTPLPVEEEYQYLPPKPSADEDRYEPSEIGSEFYDPTPSEYQDDIDYQAGTYDDDYVEIEIEEILEFFTDVIQ